jgi:hypothetical protein
MADLVKTVKRTRINPTKDADTANLATSTAAAWALDEDMKLKWITSAQHTSNAKLFNASVSERISLKGDRQPLSVDLKGRDKQIDLGITAIKNALIYKFGKEGAVGRYLKFGIEHTSKAYMLPRDRNKRVTALPVIVASITEFGLENEKYGLDFWQEMATNYTALFQQTVQADGSSSLKSGDRSDLRDTIIKTHNALIHLIKANYPDNYTEVLRSWGFQKEKY